MNINALAEDLSIAEDECLEIMGLFIETGMDDLKKLACAIERGDAQQAAMAAHAVKGAAANLRLLDISEKARQIEASIYQGQWHAGFRETLELLQAGLISIAEDLRRQKGPVTGGGWMNPAPGIRS